MKIELKHLAGYLPYRLKLLSHENEMQTLTGVRDETYFIEKGNVYAYGDIQDCKPILRPLSDYEKFDAVLDEMSDFEIQMIEDNPDLTKRLSYDVIVEMFRHHIDIYGLINKGLAIDINTI